MEGNLVDNEAKDNHEGQSDSQLIQGNGAD